MNEQVKDLINKIPIIPLTAAIMAYMAWDHYTFMTDPTSELGLRRGQIETAQSEVRTLQNRLNTAKEFERNLEAKKVELRTLALELDGMKNSISTELDVPEFMKMVVTEAKKTGLKVIRIRPDGREKMEYYTEHNFDFVFRGVYVQLLVFLDRMSQASRIVRIGEFSIKPISSASARFVELEGAVQLKGYSYVGSKADEVGRDKDKEKDAAKEKGTGK